MNNTNSKKLVSVIIAAYNVGAYISRALESVLAQTYTDIEVVIVNDGSTDTTEKILEDYSIRDARIVVVTQTNKGVSAARNAGLAQATGEYLCLFDADDIMLPTRVQAQVEFLNERPGVDFVYSNVWYFMDGTYDIYTHPLATVSGPGVYKTLLHRGNFIYTSTVCFRRGVFDTYGGFDESLRSAEEFEYWLRLAQHNVVIVYQDRYLILCRSRSNGLTSDTVTMYRTARAVFDAHLSTRVSKLLSYQYLKITTLLYFSLLKRHTPQPEHVSHSGAQRQPNLASKIFALLKNIKFHMTFKKVDNNGLRDFLVRIETSTSYESTH